MICAKCGANNPSESAYCGGCGSFLAPAPESAAESGTPGQEAPVIAPSEPFAQPVASVNEDMPTFHAMPPQPVQDSPAVKIEEGPTMRVMPEQSVPAASEFMGSAPVTPPEVPGGYQPASPTPVVPQVSGPLPAPAPGTAYPQQGQMPIYPAGMYPQQGQTPGYPSGALYPQQGQTPGYPSGALYPQQGQAAGFPSGAQYPPNTPLPAPRMPMGAYPLNTPLPGYPSGAQYPQQGQVAGFPSGAQYPQQGQPSGVLRRR